MNRSPPPTWSTPPTAHLDAHVRDVFRLDLVARRRGTGAAGVYATHDAEEALGLADRVALLRDGRLVQVDTPQQVYEEPVDLFAARLTGPASVDEAPDGAGRLLVRPGWARLGGPLEGRLPAVWFRGPHSDPPRPVRRAEVGSDAVVSDAGLSGEQRRSPASPTASAAEPAPSTS